MTSTTQLPGTVRIPVVELRPGDTVIARSEHIWTVLEIGRPVASVVEYGEDEEPLSFTVDLPIVADDGSTDYFGITQIVTVVRGDNPEEILCPICGSLKLFIGAATCGSSDCEHTALEEAKAELEMAKAEDIELGAF